jgi:hypothetical protein
MTYLSTMASYLPIHNPPKYFTFTHMYKIYIYIYILHITYVVKRIEAWSLWFHTNVLAIKPPHHFVKQ